MIQTIVKLVLLFVAVCSTAYANCTWYEFTITGHPEVGCVECDVDYEYNATGPFSAWNTPCLNTENSCNMKFNKTWDMQDSYWSIDLGSSNIMQVYIGDYHETSITYTYNSLNQKCEFNTNNDTECWKKVTCSSQGRYVYVVNHFIFTLQTFPFSEVNYVVSNTLIVPHWPIQNNETVYVVMQTKNTDLSTDILDMRLNMQFDLDFAWVLLDQSVAVKGDLQKATYPQKSNSDEVSYDSHFTALQANGITDILAQFIYWKTWDSPTNYTDEWAKALVNKTLPAMLTTFLLNPPTGVSNIAFFPIRVNTMSRTYGMHRLFCNFTYAIASEWLNLDFYVNPAAPIYTYVVENRGYVYSTNGCMYVLVNGSVPISYLSPFVLDNPCTPQTCPAQSFRASGRNRWDCMACNELHFYTGVGSVHSWNEQCGWSGDSICVTYPASTEYWQYGTYWVLDLEYTRDVFFVIFNNSESCLTSDLRVFVGDVLETGPIYNFSTPNQQCHNSSTCDFQIKCNLQGRYVYVVRISPNVPQETYVQRTDVFPYTTMNFTGSVNLIAQQWPLQHGDKVYAVIQALVPDSNYTMNTLIYYFSLPNNVVTLIPNKTKALYSGQILEQQGNLVSLTSYEQYDKNYTQVWADYLQNYTDSTVQLREALLNPPPNVVNYAVIAMTVNLYGVYEDIIPLMCEYREVVGNELSWSKVVGQTTLIHSIRTPLEYRGYNFSSDNCLYALVQGRPPLPPILPPLALKNPCVVCNCPNAQYFYESACNEHTVGSCVGCKRCPFGYMIKCKDNYNSVCYEQHQCLGNTDNASQVVPAWLAQRTDIRCLRGQYIVNISKGVPECKECPANTISIDGIYCDTCRGYRIAYQDQDTCVCKTPSLQSETGQCLCGVGHEFNTLQGCIPCANNTFSNYSNFIIPESQWWTTEKSCQTCPLGSYSLEGQSHCTVCPQFQYRVDPLHAYCSSCAAGYYAPASDSAVCVACDTSCLLGQYSSVCPTDQLKYVCHDCHSLPTHAQWLDKSALATEYKCIWKCDTGFYRNFTQCVPCSSDLVCPAGKVRSECTDISDHHCDNDCVNQSKPLFNSVWDYGCNWKCQDGFQIKTFKYALYDTVECWEIFE